MSDLPAAQDQSLPAVMEQNHPFHGACGRVFEQMGGEDALLEWAKKNPGAFFNLMAKLSPKAEPLKGPPSTQIQINNQLGPSPLDG